jgi:hypothetical protein
MVNQAHRLLVKSRQELQVTASRAHLLADHRQTTDSQAQDRKDRIIPQSQGRIPLWRSCHILLAITLPDPAKDRPQT